jgi:hypothetical protein
VTTTAAFTGSINGSSLPDWVISLRGSEVLYITGKGQIALPDNETPTDAEVMAALRAAAKRYADMDDPALFQSHHEWVMEGRTYGAQEVQYGVLAEGTMLEAIVGGLIIGVIFVLFFGWLIWPNGSAGLSDRQRARAKAIAEDRAIAAINREEERLIRLESVLGLKQCCVCKRSVATKLETGGKDVEHQPRTVTEAILYDANRGYAPLGYACPSCVAAVKGKKGKAK